MKSLSLIFLTLYCLLLLSACGNLFCNSEAQLAPNDGYEEIGVAHNLGSSTILRELGVNSLIIRNEDDYVKYIGYQWTTKSSTIDWSKYSLVGAQRRSLQCGDELSKSLSVNHSSKEYHIKFYSCDGCWENYEYMVNAWFKIPKSPAAYTVKSTVY